MRFDSHREKGGEQMQTPCDVPIIDYDDDGKEVEQFVCPYADGYTGYESEMCRNCCGLGVDE